MITPAEHAYIAAHAYVPEHLPHYVTAISQTEPFLVGNFVVHVRGARLIFVGYPLNAQTCLVSETMETWHALDESKVRFKPTIVSIIAPALDTTLTSGAPSSPDNYYRLDLAQLVIPPKTRNMLNRARRDVSVNIGVFGKEHQRLIEEFLRAHRLDDATRFIFQRVPAYARCDTARVLEARDARGNLVAFDIVEFGAQNYAFYMFNFRSHKYNIPGASDLLLAHIVDRAQAEGKQYINLGLGIDAGVTFFKHKWGATPFLKYVACMQQTITEAGWLGLFNKL